MRYDTSKLDRILGEAGKAAIIGHLNPDGDSIGSVTAAWHYLTGRGIASTIILPNPHPASLWFLNPDGAVVLTYEASPSESISAIEEADLIVCLDFNQLSRVEQLGDAIGHSKARKVLIDHHISPQADIFDVCFSRTDISSACELLFWVLMDMPEIGHDTHRLSIECAESLYVGMMTDTNNFNNSVYPSTFEMASLLIERGVDKESLQDKVLFCYSESRMRLMGHMLKDRMAVVKGPDGMDAAYLMLSNKEKSEYGFSRGDSEGFVNLPLSISSVKLSAMFTENDDGQYIRVSLRSKGDVDVNQFARRFFNGGGHRNASGGRLYMKLEEIPSYFERCLANFN